MLLNCVTLQYRLMTIARISRPAAHILSVNEPFCSKSGYCNCFCVTIWNGLFPLVQPTRPRSISEVSTIFSVSCFVTICTSSAFSSGAGCVCALSVNSCCRLCTLEFPDWKLAYFSLSESEAGKTNVAITFHHLSPVMGCKDCSQPNSQRLNGPSNQTDHTSIWCLHYVCVIVASLSGISVFHTYRCSWEFQTDNTHFYFVPIVVFVFSFACQAGSRAQQNAAVQCACGDVCQGECVHVCLRVCRDIQPGTELLLLHGAPVTRDTSHVPAHSTGYTGEECFLVSESILILY